MSPSFGNLMTSAICWWFQKYVSIYFLLNKILKNRFKILIFWLFPQFVKNWDFLNIFFLKPGLTKTFCFMTDFQFSLDGAALFMLFWAPLGHLWGRFWPRRRPLSKNIIKQQILVLSSWTFWGVKRRRTSLRTEVSFWAYLGPNRQSKKNFYGSKGVSCKISARSAQRCRIDY